MSKNVEKKIVMPIADYFDEREFIYPYFRLLEAGYAVTVVGQEAGASYKSKSGLVQKSEKAFEQIKAEQYDGVVIPGGFGPDYIRRSKSFLEFVKKLSDSGKLVAFICHAGWVPISAGILKGRRATSVSAIKDDLVNAGCQWEDRSLVRDGNLISSRTPDDLPDFMKGVLEVLEGK